MLGADGRLDPTIATLAARAGVGLSAVREALTRLKAFRFLTWERRLVRNQAGGWRCSQTSNAYVLLVPACESGFRREVQGRFTYEAEKEGRQGDGGTADAELAANAGRNELLAARKIAFYADQAARLRPVWARKAA